MFVENQENHTVTFCQQLKVEKNTENQEETGYFGGHQAYFIGNQRGKPINVWPIFLTQKFRQCSLVYISVEVTCL